MAESSIPLDETTPIRTRGGVLAKLGWSIAGLMVGITMAYANINNDVSNLKITEGQLREEMKEMRAEMTKLRSTLERIAGYIDALPQNTGKTRSIIPPIDREYSPEKN